MGAILPPNVILNGVKAISKDDLKNLEYDLILVTGHKASLEPILKEAETLGINPDKVVLDRTVCVPLFTLEKYNKLRHSQLTIFSRDCSGGNIYHRFGLPFLSPTINMFIREEDILTFLKAPINTMNQPLIYKRDAFEGNRHFYYPVFRTGEVEWHMNHYDDIKFAMKKWYERKSKINWLNVFVVMWAANPETLAEFDKLPYPKKICIVPFKTDLESGVFLDPAKYCPGGYKDFGDFGDFGDFARKVSRGEIIEFDIWDMLLYGKKTPLSVQN